jgi:c-di-GMP-related signal transduction protein
MTTIGELDTSTRPWRHDVVVVGRQPIVDRDGAVFGFELLYRATDSETPALDGDQMTARVVLSALTIGVNQLVGDKVIFCNVGRGEELGAIPVTLPPERTVIEVLESVRIDEASLAGCRDLVERGYRLALDDFVWTEGAEQLLELASIVKIDFRAGGRDEIRALAARCREYDVVLLAEKVETDDDVAWARDLGFELFQGYAIERPRLVSGQTVTASSVTRAQLAATVLGDDLDYAEIEAILRHEPGLVLQVLQMAAIGAAHGLRREVRTVREALVLLGTTRIRQWIGLTMLSDQPGAGPDGLATALVRARMCELLAGDRGCCAPDFAFTVGLLSALDVLLGVPVHQLAESLELDPELSQAAFGRTGAVGQLVSEVENHQRALPSPDAASGGRADLDHAAAAAFRWAMPYLNALDA